MSDVGRRNKSNDCSFRYGFHGCLGQQFILTLANFLQPYLTHFVIHPTRDIRKQQALIQHYDAFFGNVVLSKISIGKSWFRTSTPFHSCSRCFNTYSYHYDSNSTYLALPPNKALWLGFIVLITCSWAIHCRITVSLISCRCMPFSFLLKGNICAFVFSLTFLLSVAVTDFKIL